MARAKHLGKNVLTHERRRAGGGTPRAFSGQTHELYANASYLITGGLAGLGLLVAQWMVERGARHLVLIGRRAPSDDSLRLIEGLIRSGASIEIVRADISNRALLDQVFARFGADLPPLRGIIHSAGVVDDGILVNQ